MAQVILLIFMPIVTRLYSPSEFGMYSLFFSITMAVGLISSLRYDQAIVLPKSDRDGEALLFLSIIILLTIVMFEVVGIAVFYDLLVNFFQGESWLIWLMPISTTVIGLQNMFDTFSTRHEIYKDMSKAKVATASTTIALQLASRQFFSLNGLISGKIFADLLGILILLRVHIKKHTITLKSFSKRRAKLNLKKYDHFPKYQSGTSLVNYLSQNLPILIFPILFSSEVVGYYALAFRILMAPVSMITGSVRNVYYQRAAKMYANSEDIRSLFIKTTMGLVKLYALPFFAIIFFGEDIFGFIFGDEWRSAGLIAQVMVVMSLFTFVNPPSTMTFNILNMQKMQLFIQIVQFVLRLVAIYAGYYIFDSYIASIALYVVVAVGANIFQILYIDRRLKLDAKKLSLS